MKLEQTRPNVFTLTAAPQELSALVGGARMALEAMERDPGAPPELVSLLRRILDEYDAALARLRDDDGRSSRPSTGPSGGAAA